VCVYCRANALAASVDARNDFKSNSPGRCELGPGRKMPGDPHILKSTLYSNFTHSMYQGSDFRDLRLGLPQRQRNLLRPQSPALFRGFRLPAHWQDVAATQCVPGPSRHRARVLRRSLAANTLKKHGTQLHHSTIQHRNTGGGCCDPDSPRDGGSSRSHDGDNGICCSCYL